MTLPLFLTHAHTLSSSITVHEADTLETPKLGGRPKPYPVQKDSIYKDSITHRGINADETQRDDKLSRARRPMALAAVGHDHGHDERRKNSSLFTV